MTPGIFRVYKPGSEIKTQPFSGASQKRLEKVTFRWNGYMKPRAAPDCA